MASVRMYLIRRYTHVLSGGAVIHQQQIRVIYRVPGSVDPRRGRDAVVDLGASMSVFPMNKWERFGNLIEWLTELNDPTVPDWCKQFRGATGGSVPFRLGIIPIEFFDFRGGLIGPLPLTAMFAHDAGELTVREALIGLGGGFFSGRRFEFVYDTEEILLSDL